MAFFVLARAATQPLGAHCTIENTTYVSDMNKGAAGGGQFISYVIKHDCLAPNLFCDPTGSADGPICQKAKNLSEKCRFDAECKSVRSIFSAADSRC